MLSPPDADLVRRDTALPGLGTLLDPEAALTALQAGLPDLGLRAARAGYVRYKPGTSCLVRYDAATDTGPHLLYAKAHRADAREKLTNAREATEVEGLRAVLDTHAVVIHRFPDDRRLRRLPELIDDERQARLLRDLLPGTPALWHGRLTPLAYKPERRFVARLDTAEGAFALKLYTGAGFAKAKTGATAFAARGPFLPTRCAGRSDKHRMLAFAWLPGRTLRETLSETFPRASLVEVGAALAELHNQPAPGLPVRTRTQEAERSRALADGLSWLLPTLAERIRALACRLRQRFLDAPIQTSTVHGDFYGKQVLTLTDGVGVLDFDEAFRGDPAHDLGLFLAYLEHDALTGTLDPGWVEPARAAFLEGYRTTSGALPPRIPLYTASELFGLAPHAFRNRRPDWPDLSTALLDRIETLLRIAPERSR